MRIMKLFLPGVLTVCVLGVCGLPAQAASPSALCQAEAIDALHADRRYPLDDRDVMVHASSGRLALSRLALDEMIRERLPDSGSLLILDLFSSHHASTYQLLADASAFASLTGHARTSQRNLIYLALADPHPPSSLSAIAPGQRASFEQPGADTHALLHTMCAALPTEVTLEQARVEHGVRGTLWHIVVRDAEGEQIGVLVAWLDASQTQHARDERWGSLAGTSLLGVLVLGVMFVVWRRRQRRELPAWKQAQEDPTACPSCGRKHVVSGQMCPACQASHDAGEPLSVEHNRAVNARRDVLVMLITLDAMAPAHQGLFAGLFGTHQRIATLSGLYTTQRAHIETLCASLHDAWFGAESSLAMLLGYADVASAPPYLSTLLATLSGPVPEFARATAPEPWLSHLASLHTLCDLVALELDLRRCAPPSLRLPASHV